MYDQFGREEILQTLDKLIERHADVLEDEEEELQQVRGNWLTLVLKEHIVGCLSQEENDRREVVLSRFRELQSRVDSQRASLERLRDARAEWEIELPRSLQDRFRDSLTTD